MIASNVVKVENFLTAIFTYDRSYFGKGRVLEKSNFLLMTFCHHLEAKKFLAQTSKEADIITIKVPHEETSRYFDIPFTYNQRRCRSSHNFRIVWPRSLWRHFWEHTDRRTSFSTIISLQTHCNKLDNL